MFAWSAVAPPFDGRTTATRVTAAAEILAGWRELRTAGAGYVEVSPAEAPYPCLTVGFEQGQAVVHRLMAEGEVDLLLGDGSVDPVTDVEVFHGDEYPGVFSGEFVSSVDRIDPLLEGFLSGRPLDELGSWERL